MVVSIPKALTGILSTLSATLPQSQTNGDSKWGTLEAPQFPEFVLDNPLRNVYPWGGLTVENNNPCSSTPNTGVVRRYNFNIHRTFLAPDGVKKEAIVVNNQFPGPGIEANWGDWVEVRVKNSLNEGTSLHWHGLLQKGNPWMDGVPSVMQCPITPGSTFTYRFRADIYGTSWWHSHYSAQYTAGLSGPLIIHGPSHLKGKDKYDIDLGPVFLNDWFHNPHNQILKGLMGKNPEAMVAAVTSQNNLINGKMAFNCSNTDRECTDGAGISKFKFQTGKRHLLRLINAGAEAQQEFSIDEHMLTVVAHDFVPVKPYTVPSVSLANGQRMDVIVEATGKQQKSYFMRSMVGTLCAPTTQPLALAVIYYPGADHNQTPDSIPRNDTINDCHKADYALNTIEPIYKIPVKTPDFTQKIVMTYAPNATGHYVWGMNGVNFRANFNNPSLLLANSGNFSYPKTWSIINTKNSKVVRIYLTNEGEFAFMRHPMHLHGHNMQILASGVGTWDGTIVNPSNPSRRDTYVVPANGYMVLQYEADNPGIWPLHCHVAWHSAQGMYVNLMEGVNEIQRLKIPDNVRQTCRDWGRYTKTTIVDQIDAGV